MITIAQIVTIINGSFRDLRLKSEDRTRRMPDTWQNI